MSVFVQSLLSVLLVIATLAITQVRGLFALLVLMSVFSGLMATLYCLLGAVDVGFTEAVVGTGLSTLFLMAMIRQVGSTEIRYRPLHQRLKAMAVSVGVGVILLFGVQALPDADTVAGPVARTYVERAYVDMHTPNVVTAILADYRGFDTLIETTVVLTAALACLLILGREDP